MRLNHPGELVWILLSLVILFLIALRIGKVRKRLSLFANAEVIKTVLPNYRSGVLFSSGVIFFFVTLFLVFTLMEPQWGSKEEMVKKRGIDLILMVDLSQSMMASDLKPNRLERQKRKIIDLIEMLKGDRVALIFFAGKSILQIPFTTDYHLLKGFITDLSTDKIAVQGTDFAGALSLALHLFNQEKQKRSQAILLFTDGEDHNEETKKSLEKLKERGIRLYIVGLGTLEGAPVPDPNGGFKRDKQNQIIISKLNEKLLQDMAVASKGAYVRSMVSNEDIAELYLKGIRKSLSKSDFASQNKILWISRYRYPLFIACLLLSLERVLALFIRGKKT